MTEAGDLTEHVNVRFPEHLARAAAQLAARDGMSTGAWVRKIVDRELAAREPARTLVIDVAQIGREWVATSTDISGFTAYGDDRDGVESNAKANLAAWLDPAVRLEFRELGT